MNYEKFNEGEKDMKMISIVLFLSMLLLIMYLVLPSFSGDPGTAISGAPNIYCMAGSDNSIFQKKRKKSEIPLPLPKYRGSLTVEEAIKKRRTIRNFSSAVSLNQQMVSQILWAAQGITEKGGDKRSIASAGALYPLDVYVLVGNKGVDGLAAGLYHYHPSENKIQLCIQGDLRKKVAEAALSQTWIAHAPIIIIITAEYTRTTKKYEERGRRYVHMEVGHAGQNIFLQAEALGLNAGIVGAFQDENLKETLKLPLSYDPLLIMPIGAGN